MTKNYNGKTYNTETAVKVSEHTYKEGDFSVNEVMYQKRTGEYFLYTTKQYGDIFFEMITPSCLFGYLVWEYGGGISCIKFMENCSDENSMLNYYKGVLDNLKEKSDRYVYDLIDEWEDKGITMERIKTGWKELLDDNYSDKDIYNCLDRWEKEDYDNSILDGLDMDMVSRELVYRKCEKEVMELESIC